MDDLWVLLWSQSQCCFHVEPVEDMLKANAAAFIENRTMDYVPLVVASCNECHAAADRLRPTVQERRT